MAAMAKSIHRSDYVELIRLLQEQRLECGVTQTNLSKALGRSQSFVSDVETGKRRLDVVELRDICKLLHIDLIGFLQKYEARLATTNN